MQPSFRKVPVLSFDQYNQYECKCSSPLSWCGKLATMEYDVPASPRNLGVLERMKALQGHPLVSTITSAHDSTTGAASR
jgi:hypothetical protein